MSHAFSGLFGGGHAGPSYIPIPSAPTANTALTPALAPAPGMQPGSGGQTPSFLGSSVLPPQTGPGGGNQKRLLGQ